MTLPNVSHGDIHGLIGVIKTNFFFFFFLRGLLRQLLINNFRKILTLLS